MYENGAFEIALSIFGCGFIIATALFAIARALKERAK